MSAQLARRAVSLAMNDRGKQRVALVTGGAVRLGRAISLGLAQAGYDLVIAYRSSPDAARDVASAAEVMGRRCVTVRADLGDPSAAEAIAESAEEAYGHLDLLVNSAASFRSVPLDEIDADEWDSVMHLNVRAPHLLVRATRQMLRTAGGSVVNMVDLSAFQAWTQYPHHAVSKAALAHLTRIQARALAPEVRVNAVAPGAVLPPDDWSAERWEALADRAVLKRVGGPQDVVQAVLFLATAPFITGHVLPVDGGRLLGPRGPVGPAEQG